MITSNDVISNSDNDVLSDSGNDKMTSRRQCMLLVQGTTDYSNLLSHDSTDDSTMQNQDSHG